MAEKRIGLALGGGASRGIAHIGVLRALQELGVEISLIAGTSSGSIIGALWAAGYSVDEMIEIARATTWRDLSHLVVPRRCLLGTDRMERKLEQLLDGCTFNELKKPFAAVCADLYSAEKVVLKQGSVPRAVRASCSIPGIFPPVEWDSMLLVDGGIVENVPVLTARELGGEFIIGVDLHASISTTHQLDNIFGIMMRSLEISQRNQGLQESQTADICIEPNMAGESAADLHRVDDYVELGYQAALAHKDKLLKLNKRKAATS